MGLFDNIFLDQDTQTAVVDAPPQVENTPANPVVAEAPVIGDLQAHLGENTPQPLTSDTDISFDIGGDIDFNPTSNTGTFLEGGEVKDQAANAPVTTIANETDTLSIAMIQGATNASGAMIVGDTPEQKVETPSESTENPIETPVENTTETSNLTEESNLAVTEVDDGNQALFGLLNEETNEKTEILPVAENFPQKNETPVDIFSNEETAHIDDIAVSSPLGELDTEIISFIEKLEALRKNGTTDTQYQEKLDAVTEREKALEEEVSVRKKALEYEKAEIIREQEEQKAEEARLTRIIDGLKKETK